MGGPVGSRLVWSAAFAWSSSLRCWLTRDTSLFDRLLRCGWLTANPHKQTGRTRVVHRRQKKARLVGLIAGSRIYDRARRHRDSYKRDKSLHSLVTPLHCTLSDLGDCRILVPGAISGRDKLRLHHHRWFTLPLSLPADVNERR